jgi:hypothetical protein
MRLCSLYELNHCRAFSSPRSYVRQLSAGLSMEARKLPAFLSNLERTVVRAKELFPVTP